MSELPNGWTIAALDEVAALITDGDHNPPKRVPQGVPHLTARHVKGGYLVVDDGTFISNEDFDRVRKRYEPLPGDVIITCVGTLGQTAIVPQGMTFSADRNLAAIRPNEAVLSSFLKAVLDAPATQALIKRASGSTAQPHLYLGDLRKLAIPLPPVREQERIVAAIEAAFPRIEAGIRGLEQVRRRLKSMRAAVHEAAVHEDKWTTARSELGAGLGSGPEWRAGTVGDVAEVSGGITKNPARTPKSNPIPFLRVANVQRNELDLAEIHQVEIFEGELDRFRLRINDLLVVEGNGSPDQIGRSALWDGSTDPCVHQNHLIRVRAGEEILPEYLNIFWNSPSGMRVVQAVASSTSGLHTLSTGKVRAIRVPLPPVVTQEEIVAVVTDQLAWIDRIDEALAPALRRAQGLRRSILAAAFSGQLVPQDPNDEPASIPLDEIAPQRTRSSRTNNPARARAVRQEATA